MFEKLFNQLNLASSDARVFEELVNQKSATPLQIAKNTGISRENVYYILKKLSGLGLVAQVPSAKKLTFTLAHPDSLKDLFQQKEDGFKQARSILDEVTRQINQRLDPLVQTPAVHYYEEIAGIKQAYLDFLGNIHHQEMCGIANLFWPEELEDFFLDQRLKRRINLKVLITESKKARSLQTTDRKNDRQTKILEENQFSQGAYIAVIQDKVLMVYQSQVSIGVGIVIEHQAIASSYKALFSLLWQRY